jgi:hypothetical protein
MDSGLAALIGAFVGGSLTAGSNIWLERVRGRRALALEERTSERKRAESEQRDEREQRRAARLVFDELRHSIAVIEQAEADDEWGDADRKELKYNRWTEHQQALADHLPDDHWFTVGGAYELLYVIYRATASGEGEPSTEEYARVKEVVGGALRILRQYASGYQGASPRASSPGAERPS